MKVQKKRAIKIGIALNSANIDNATDIKAQYTTSDQMLAELSSIFHKHGAEVLVIEANGNLVSKLSLLAKEVDLIFNLAEDMYQIAVPMAIDQVHLELKQNFPVHTGAGVEGHVLALNKGLARQVLANSVQQPQWWYFGHNASIDFEQIIFPVIVKPSNEGHSIGIHQSSVVYSIEELKPLLSDLKKRFGKAVLVETFLDGIEYSMGIVGEVLMPAIAWDLNDLPGQPKVRSEDLKQQDLTIPHAKFVQEPQLMKAIARQVVNAHTGLGLRDYSRSDFRAAQSDKIPRYIETNSMPGLVNNDSVLPWSAAKAGVAYEDLISSIVAQALKRLPQKHLEQLDTRGFDASYERLLHLAKNGQKIRVQNKDYYILEPKRRNSHSYKKEVVSFESIG